MASLKMGLGVLIWINIQGRLTGVHKWCAGRGNKSGGTECDTALPFTAVWTHTGCPSLLSLSVPIYKMGTTVTILQDCAEDGIKPHVWGTQCGADLGAQPTVDVTMSESGYSSSHSQSLTISLNQLGKNHTEKPERTR